MSMMGELTYFLGLQVKQVKDGIFISQTKYIYDLLKKFDLTDCSSSKTPMATATKLEMNTKESKVDISNYRGMVGSLLYLTASRPNIMFAPLFNEEFKMQQQDLKRKEGELEKIYQVITKKAELLKVENEEKQRLHNLKVQRRKLDIRLKIGDSWDTTRRMFGLSQKSTNNDREFLQLLDSYRMANPNNSLYMEALRLEISRIVAGFYQVLDEMVIFVYFQQEGSFKVSLNLFENRTLSELWILINKVSRSTDMNELLRDHIREFAVKAGPQVISLPYSVKLFRSSSLQTCNLDPVSLRDYLARHLV